MKKRKIVNKTKFYKTMLAISAYINFLLILGIMEATGLLSFLIIFLLYINKKTKKIGGVKK